MLFKAKMFGLWVWEKSEGLRDKALMLSFFWGAIFGLLFLLVDVSHFETLQYGWFYYWFRLPTYLIAGAWLTVTAFWIGSEITGWILNQYADYQAFAMTGGKRKRKNDDPQ